MREASLESLFARYLAKGDVKALGAVFDRAAPELLAVAGHLARDPEDAEDLVQQTFLGAIEGSGRFDRSRPLMPWLVGILTRQARYRARSGARVIQPDRLGWRPAPDPREQSEREELVAALAQALREVPATYREVLTRHLADGEKPREIAAALGRAPGTVRVQLHRGLDLLRKALPPSFAMGAAVAMLPTKGLAAVKVEVLAAATAAFAAKGAGSAGLSTAAVGSRGVLAAGALAVALTGGWLAWARIDRLGLDLPDATLVAIEPQSEAVELATLTENVTPASLRSTEVVAAHAARRDDAVEDRSTDAEQPTEEEQPPERQHWFVRGKISCDEFFDGTSVSISAVGGGNVLAQTKADFLGNFELEVSEEVAPDPTSEPDFRILHVFADHPDFAIAEDTIDVSRAWAFRSRSRSRVGSVHLELQRPACILSGDVVGATGPARVGLFPVLPRSGVPFPYPADDALLKGGHYRLRVPFEGDWMVVVAPPHGAPVWKRVQIEQGPTLVLETLAVEPGRTLQGTVRMPGATSAENCVVRATPFRLLDPQPVPEQEGFVHLPNAGEIVPDMTWEGLAWDGHGYQHRTREAKVDGRNRYALGELSDVDYSLEVHQVPGIDASRESERTQVDRFAVEMELIPPVSMLKVYVHDGDGPVVGARVELGARSVEEEDTRRRTAQAITRSTDEKGEAEILVPAREEYELRVNTTRHIAQAAPVTSPAPGANLRRKMSLERVDYDPARLALSAAVEVTSIEVSWSSGSHSGRTSLEPQDGVFQLDGLPPGRATVEVRSNGTAPVYFSPLTVQLAPSESRSAHLTLAAEGRLQLRIPNEPGVDLFASIKSNMRRVDTDFIAVGNVEDEAPRELSDNGSFAQLPRAAVVENATPMPPGRYRVVVHDTRGRQTLEDVTVRAGLTTVLDVELGPLDFESLGGLDPEEFAELVEELIQRRRR